MSNAFGFQVSKEIGERILRRAGRGLFVVQLKGCQEQEHHPKLELLRAWECVACALGA